MSQGITNTEAPKTPIVFAPQTVCDKVIETAKNAKDAVAKTVSTAFQGVGFCWNATVKPASLTLFHACSSAVPYGGAASGITGVSAAALTAGGIIKTGTALGMGAGVPLGLVTASYGRNYFNFYDKPMDPKLSRAWQVFLKTGADAVQRSVLAITNDTPDKTATTGTTIGATATTGATAKFISTQSQMAGDFSTNLWLSKHTNGGICEALTTRWVENMMQTGDAQTWFTKVADAPSEVEGRFLQTLGDVPVQLEEKVSTSVNEWVKTINWNTSPGARQSSVLYPLCQLEREMQPIIDKLNDAMNELYSPAKPPAALVALFSKTFFSNLYDKLKALCSNNEKPDANTIKKAVQDSVTMARETMSQELTSEIKNGKVKCSECAGAMILQDVKSEEQLKRLEDGGPTRHKIDLTHKVGFKNEGGGFARDLCQQLFQLAGAGKTCAAKIGLAVPGKVGHAVAAYAGMEGGKPVLHFYDPNFGQIKFSGDSPTQLADSFAAWFEDYLSRSGYLLHFNSVEVDAGYTK